MISNKEDNFFFYYGENENEKYPLGYNIDIFKEEKENKIPVYNQSISEVKTDADDNNIPKIKREKKSIINDDDNWSQIVSIKINDEMEVENNNKEFSFENFIIAPIMDKNKPFLKNKREDNNNDNKEFYPVGHNMLDIPSLNREIKNKENNKDDFSSDWNNLPCIQIPLCEKKEEKVFNISSNNANNEMVEEFKSNMQIEEESTETRRHTKYSDDNIRRKCKHIILDGFFYFVNSKIRKFYNNNIGKGILEKQLKTLNQTQKSEANIIFNQKFLDKTMGEIFSEKISGRITNFPSDHNKKLIESLLNEDDPLKRLYFNELFSLTFFQCLQHFRKEKKFPVLNGMTTLPEQLEKFSDDKDYYTNLDYYFKNYEKIIYNKKSRKKRKNKAKGKNSNL